jgi:hypothetical protein
MSNLLKEYIRLAVLEAHDARVPNQLVSDDVDDDESGEAVDEMGAGAGSGGIAGYTAPLGADPDQLGRSKNGKR